MMWLARWCRGFSSSSSCDGERRADDGVSPVSRSPPSSPKALDASQVWDLGVVARWAWLRLSRSVALAWRRNVTGAPKRRAGGLVVRKNPPPGQNGTGTVLPGPDDSDRGDYLSWSSVSPGDEEVLLVSSRRNPAVWILPSGTVERGETTRAAALREVAEEAGVGCVIRSQIGTFADNTSLASTAIYLMRVETDSGRWEHQEHGRKRRWWRLADAYPLLKPRDRVPLREYLMQKKKQATQQQEIPCSSDEQQQHQEQASSSSSSASLSSRPDD